MTDLCSVHMVNIGNLYSDVISAYINAAEYIPTTAPPRTKCVPGWKEYVDKLMNEILYWHGCWTAQGSPYVGDIAQIRRILKARYHNVIKIVKSEEDKIQMERMAEAMASNNDRNLFFEVKIKGHGNILAACVDVTQVIIIFVVYFGKKYDDLYNSVQYVEEEMVKI